MRVGTLTGQNGYYIFENIGWKGAGDTFAALQGDSRNNLFFRCGIYDTAYTGFSLPGLGQTCIGCEARDWGTAGGAVHAFEMALGSAAHHCYARKTSTYGAQSSLGFYAGGDASLTNCIVNGANIGFTLACTSVSYQMYLLNCAAYGTASHGFQVPAVSAVGTAAGGVICLANFGYYGCADTIATGLAQIIRLGGLDEFAIDEMPFVDPDNHNFAIKSKLAQLIRSSWPYYFMVDGDEQLALPNGYDLAPVQSAWHPRRT
jgi:hypothetical protein